MRADVGWMTNRQDRVRLNLLHPKVDRLVL